MRESRDGRLHGPRWEKDIHDRSGTVHTESARCPDDAPALQRAPPWPWSAPEVLLKIASAAAEIVFDHVTKRYGESTRPAVDDLSITIPAGEICVLVGPSGGGKSTAMRMVNRLIWITEGDITIDGDSVNRLDPVELAARDRLRGPADRRCSRT